MSIYCLSSRPLMNIDSELTRYGESLKADTTFIFAGVSAASTGKNLCRRPKLESF